jgi:hypothetical protein
MRQGRRKLLGHQRMRWIGDAETQMMHSISKGTASIPYLPPHSGSHATSASSSSTQGMDQNNSSHMMTTNTKHALTNLFLAALAQDQRQRRASDETVPVLCVCLQVTCRFFLIPFFGCLCVCGVKCMHPFPCRRCLCARHPLTIVSRVVFLCLLLLPELQAETLLLLCCELGKGES